MGLFGRYPPPRWIRLTLIVLTVCSLIPLALFARARHAFSPQPRVHALFDMANQLKFKTQSENTLFEDNRAMRPPVDGTVARGQLHEDEQLYRGRQGADWSASFPSTLKVDLAFVKRGQERFGIYCAPCHGYSGYGDGAVARRADQLQEGTWVVPASFHTDLVRARPVGHLYNTITNGIRNMPGYAAQIPVEDRWAIVAYVRALQRSQTATAADAPADMRSSTH